MIVKYDRSTQIGGIGVSPWPRLGPHLWFNDYKIASYYDWDIKLDTAPEVKSLMGYKPQTLPSLNTQNLLNNHDFQQILKNDFTNRSIFTYKPMSLNIPSALKKSGLRLLGPKVSKSYENKLVFRKAFKDKLPLPQFTIIGPEDKPDLYKLLKNKEAIVLQNESLSGGKGTSIVRDAEGLTAALKRLRKKGRHIIASEYIEGARERSLQCCVTRFGIFIGPLQKQLVNRKQLVNPLNSDKFCGAEISPSDSLYGLYDEMQAHCKLIGEELDNDGYRGVFGVDFLISPQGRVYVLEVNQRLTGVTPLLTMLYRPEEDIPFYLLHILEQGNLDYSITDLKVNRRHQAGSLLICHSFSTSIVSLEETVDSGLYDDEDINFISQAFWPKRNTNEILLQQMVSPATTIRAGAKLVTAFIPSEVLDRQDNFTPAASSIIDKIYRKIRLSDID